MPQGVPKRLPEPLGRDRIPGQGIGLAPRHAGPDPVPRPPLRALHQLVERSLRGGGGSPDHHRAGDIRRVSVHNGAKV